MTDSEHVANIEKLIQDMDKAREACHETLRLSKHAMKLNFWHIPRMINLMKIVRQNEANLRYLDRHQDTMRWLFSKYK